MLKFLSKSLTTLVFFTGLSATLTMSGMLPSQAFAAAGEDKKSDKPDKPAEVTTVAAQPDSITEGSVTVGGQAIAYKAIAGMLTVGATNSQDAMLGLDGKLLPGLRREGS